MGPEAANKKVQLEPKRKIGTTLLNFGRKEAENKACHGMASAIRMYVRMQVQYVQYVQYDVLYNVYSMYDMYSMYVYVYVCMYVCIWYIVLST